MQYDHHIGVDGKDCSNYLLLGIGQTHMCTVVSFRLKRVGEPCKYDGYIRFFSSCHSLLNSTLIELVFLGGESGDISYLTFLTFALSRAQAILLGAMWLEPPP